MFVIEEKLMEVKFLVNTQKVYLKMMKICIESKRSYDSNLGWEAMWNGLIEWFGIDLNETDYMFPNKKNLIMRFITKKQMF